MALKSFHRMMDLPLEIRCEIYFLATPDRVVQVRYPYPSYINKRCFFCNTLIPPLLHTFWESRDFLKRTGYKLAFQYPSTESQFWFNFKRDTLFIDRRVLALMSRGINPFPFEDTQRIRRIVYERAEVEDYNQGVTSALQSFGELQEIFLIEWHRAGLDLYTPWVKSSGVYVPDPTRQRNSYDARNLCKFTEIQKIDAFLYRLLPQNDPQNPCSWKTGRWCTPWKFLPTAPIPRDTDLAKYLSEPYEKWRSLDQKREDLELDLAEYWATLGRPRGKLPKLKPVHLLTDAEHQHIRRQRSIGCEMLQKEFRMIKRFGSTKDNHITLWHIVESFSRQAGQVKRTHHYTMI